jgi:ketosteroid isomerase-like protein
MTQEATSVARARRTPSRLRRLIPIGAAAVCVVLALPERASAQAGGAQPLPSVQLPPELDRVLRDYERAWQSGDEAGLVAIFTTDGFVATPTGWIRGSEAIRRNYESSQGPLRLRAHAFAMGDSVGYIVGAYGYGEEQNAPDGGKFLLALRRGADGRWLIAADLDNANRRPQGPGGGQR